MMRVLQILLLWLCGVSLLAFGVAFLIAPLETFAALGIKLDGAIAATELRAFYGGLELALGVLICACALVPSRRRDGLLLSAAVFLGIGVARLSGMLQLGADAPFLRVAVASELGLGLFALALFLARGKLAP